MALFRSTELPSPPEPVVGVAHAVEPRSIERNTVVSGWQPQAWRIWATLGEIHYPTTQVARLVARLNWETEPDYDLDGMLVGLGTHEASRLMGLNLQVAGEAWLIETDWNQQLRPVDTHWEVLSVVSPKWKDRVEKANIKVRVLNPDPTDEEQADSAVRAALGPATELITLESLSRAQSRSRIAQAGILLRPSTARKMTDENGEPVDFNELLTEAMTTPIIDETSTSALVPLDIEWDPETIEKWKHLTLDRPYDEKVHERMERCIRRIALALDIWPELLLGMADANHWGAWFINEDTWRGHAAPLAEQIGEAFEVAISEKDGSEVTVIPDPSELLARRSTVPDAVEGAKLGAVGLAFIRDAIGATDEDAPSDEDLEIIAALTGHTLPGDEPEPEPSAEQIGGPPSTEDEATRETAPVAAPVAAAIGGDVTVGLGVELARIDDQLRGWLGGAADAVIPVARARVGMQVRNRLRGQPEHAVIDGVDNGDVAAVLGAARSAEVIEVEPVVRASVEPIRLRWLRRLEGAARQVERLAPVDLSGIAHQAHREESAAVLVEDLTEWIVATLGSRSVDLGVGPDLRRVLAVAGGG